jgi:lysine-N-methylase
MNKIKVLVPAFYETFNCIGGACEENCCEADWKIYIDKSTYNLYRGIKDPDFVKKLPERVKRVKSDEQTDKHYAQIVLDEDGKCKFLEDGMCSIQLKYGFKYLSTICLIFPRKQLKQVGDNLETTLSMACPEAVREGLYPEEKMTFKFIEIENTHGKSLAALNPTRFDPGINVLGVYAQELRHCCIEIMQTRATSLSDRIFAIGMMLKRLRELSDTGDYSAVPDAALKYVISVQSGQLNGVVASLAANEEVEAGIKAKLFNAAIFFNGKDYSFKSFIPCVEQLAEKLGKKPEELTHLEMNQMTEAAAAYWREFLDTRGHILENYFVNYIFGNVFPFALPLGIQHQILILAQAYALFRIIFCCIAEREGKITDENITTTLTALFRHTNHSSMINTVTENYILSGMDTLAHASFMLRD